jgi:hypothetical protein
MMERSQANKASGSAFQ